MLHLIIVNIYSYILKTTPFICYVYRNGGGHEEGRLHGRRADRRGAKSAVGGVQECDWSTPCLVAHHHLDRTEGGEQGGRGEIEMIKTYRGQVEKELRDICSDILNVLEKHLIPCATSGESKVFYYKMKGDYHRYLAEFATGSDRKDAAENSLIAYKAASDIAMNDLPPTHPIRLGLALNFSVSDCEETRCRHMFSIYIF